MTNPANSRNQVSNFIQRLLHPPSLHNPLRRSNSQKHIQDANDINPPSEAEIVGLSKILLPTPIKHRSKSDEKANQLFSNQKNYAQPFEGSASVMLSKISQLSQPPFGSIAKKQVRFKDSIIHKNVHNRREIFPRPRTPSILKRSQLLRQNALQSMQAINSTHLQRQNSLSVFSAEDRQSRAAKSNQVVKKRYFTILQRFQAKFSSKLKRGIKMRNDQKYKDQLFPPINSSIFRGGALRPQETRSQTVRWVRVADLFKNRRITVLPEGSSTIEIYCNKWRSCNNFIGDAFTCIKDCRPLLDKVFEFRQQSPFGIYMVKIFQQNVWKYVIIDDYIPTYLDQEGNCVPIHLNICELATETSEKPIEIWPFLLEKAYANYYANYQSLHYGNTLDFLQEISGSASQTFQFTSKANLMKQTLKRLENYLQRENVVSLGYIEQRNVYVPLYRNQLNRLVAKRSYETSTQEIAINMENIFEYFDKVHILLPGKWIYNAVSTVAVNVRKGAQELPRFDISLRVLKVYEGCQVNLAVRQKEKRFYQNSSLNYTYIWNRIVILQKEFSGDLRWHSAQYTCNKSVSFTEFFQAGEYYIVMLPEWKCSHCYQLSVLVQATRPISISRKEYDDKQRILEKGCADLAQRFGRLEQINLYACSYCIVEEQAGLVIENINNERFNGDIRINRSISAIRSSIELLPFNMQFYQPRNNKLPFRTQICVYIPADKCFTVVLMTRGGIDLPLLKRFDFAK